jgi:glutaconate CoA-transferase subunit B
MNFHEESKRMQVESLSPGVTLDQVQENTGFELLKAPEIAETQPPREEELRILRDEVDPYRYVIGR